MNRNDLPEVRRKIAYVGAWNIVMLDRRNPYIVVFWSMAYAGLGHIFLDKYFRGIILFVGKTLFNYLAHLNIAIFYSVTGRFDLTAQVLDARWLLLYMAVYCLAIFDSYREAVEINNTYILAAREDSQINCFA